MKELRPLWRLKQRARQRKSGYLQTCLALGQLDEKTGIVKFSPEAWMKIRQEYALPKKPCNLATIPEKLKRRTPLRLGDAIAKIATPIARAAKMDCVDAATGQLKPDSGCFQRKTALNKIKLPFQA
ncbi:MAG TPA: hypothetical protein VH595_07775 [Verrucomicrobiae bacterium]|jgi:hypothetical protein|nr:hypothetical protein [Verrucomicrobiae bacterium]